jgi:hypothetical protein
MGNRHRESVGSVRRGGALEPEDDLHHLGYLFLVSPSCPRDRPLDPRRRILRNFESRPGTHEEGNTPRVAELGGGLRVLREEKILDACVRRMMSSNDDHELAFDRDESIGECRSQVHMDDAVCDVPEARPLTPDHSPTEVSRAGVEPENDDHASLLAPLGHLFVGDVEVSVYVLHVVVVIERLGQIQRDLGVTSGQWLLRLR